VSPSCPDCRAPLIQVRDLWNRERFVHPDTECVIVNGLHHAKGYERPTRTFICQNCDKPFEAKNKRRGCSTKCTHAIKVRHLRKGRPLWKPRPREGRRVQTLREYWQQRAIEQDRRFAA
jgi:uncharacterized protein YlaI